MFATRLVAARRLPSIVVTSRAMSSNNRGEGSVASSKGFRCIHAASSSLRYCANIRILLQSERAGSREYVTISLIFCSTEHDIIDEYARRHEAELLKKLRVEVRFPSLVDLP